ncbi:MAG TPA: sigma-70 family RNA polymerase sigma factor [Actinomycetota bacterium]|nr:sigma-70 family RNA polymerase sigma factor [Actinomycetota bacterium]
MTTQVESSFEAVWPDLERRIHRFLSSKKVPDSQREDVVQETGLRLYRMWAQVDPAGSPIGLALTIAMNIVRDNARRDSHRTVVEIEPDVPAICDVERSGLARLELSRVRRALAELTPAQRSVLLSELDRNQRPPEASPAAIKMLRMRARRNLSAILERAGAGVLVGKVRRFFGLPQHVIVSRDLPKVEQGVASSLASVMAAAAISLSPITGLLGFGGADAAEDPAPGPHAVAEEVWLAGSSVARATATLPQEAIAGDPRPANLLGESPLVRRSEAAVKAKGAGRAAKAPRDEEAPVVDVALPNGEGQIQGNGSVEVHVPPPTLKPHDDNPFCDPTQPGCTPDPSLPATGEAEAYIRVREVEVEVEVNTDEVADTLEAAIGV